MHAHLPRQERAAEPRADRRRARSSRSRRRAFSTGAASGHASCGSRRRSSRCWWRARWRRSTAAHRGGAQPRRRQAAGPLEHRAAAGRGTLLVGLVLSFVTMLSVLSVPMMIIGGSPTMITVDMAFRINAYGDYGVANALGFVSYLLAGARRLGLPAPAACAGTRRRERARPRCGCRAAALLGLLAFAGLRAAREPRPLGVRREVVLPARAAARPTASRSGPACSRPRADAMASLGTERLIAALTVRGLRRRWPCRPATRWRACGCRWRGAILLLFLLPQAFPSLPIYMNIARIFYALGLNGTMPGVVLVHAVHGLVLAVWIATAAFAAVDRELEQAARNMGASAAATASSPSRCRWRRPASWRAPSSCSSNRSTSSPARTSSACPT